MNKHMGLGMHCEDFILHMMPTRKQVPATEETLKIDRSILRFAAGAFQFFIILIMIRTCIFKVFPASCCLPLFVKFFII